MLVLLCEFAFLSCGMLTADIKLVWGQY